MNAQILKLDKAGNPSKWIDRQAAATFMAKGLVLWSMGEDAALLRGGIQRVSGSRSIMNIPPVIAIQGHLHEKAVPRMTNRLLFARDRMTCLYCGNVFSRDGLSCDHVIPDSRGGDTSWENCVTACKRCNHHKADKTPEEAGMELLAVPFAPNLYEWFYLANRHVLADQMDYLKSGFKNVLVN